MNDTVYGKVPKNIRADAGEKMMKSKVFFLLLFFPLTITIIIVGCATIKIVPVSLQNLSNEEIIETKFEFSGNDTGKISFQLPSGEHFYGEYYAVQHDDTEWGIIFNQAWSSSIIFFGPKRTGDRSSAVMEGDKGTILSCEYVILYGGSEGLGACRNNKNVIYRLTF